MHGYTFVAVSIGLVVNKVPVLGVIYNPLLDEMYVAWKGGKARLNGKVISVGKSTCLNDALIVNNIGSSREHGFILQTLYRLQRLLLQDLQALRMSGKVHGVGLGLVYPILSCHVIWVGGGVQARRLRTWLMWPVGGLTCTLR